MDEPELTLLDGVVDKRESEQIRLVIWDMDETFWSGTLTEGGIEYIDAHHEIVIELARRGIMSSICSKNDIEPVKRILVEKGLWDYFIFPSINWEPKGQRIAAIVDAVQLRASTILFIDDNAMNRNEALHFVPGLQVADESIIETMLHSASCAGKSDAGLTRLGQYKILERRNADSLAANGNNQEFLRKARIKVTILTDIESHLDRTVELINRTNQLNFTKLRLSPDPTTARIELTTLLNGFQFQAALITVQDAYGDYGICGFYCHDILFKRMVHFCFSCRIMGMGVEQWLYKRLGSPSLNVIGDVVSELHSDQEIDWIELENNAAMQSVKATKLYDSVYLWGGCELEIFAFYFRQVSRAVVSDFNVTRSGLQVRRDHTSHIPLIFGGVTEDQFKELQSLGYDQEDLSSPLTKQFSHDLYILAFTADVTFWQYRSKLTDVIIPAGNWGHEDVTSLSDEKINERFASDQVRQVAHIMRESFECLRGPSEETFKRNVRTLFDRIPTDKPIFILETSEEWKDITTGVTHSLSDRAALNKWVRDALADRQRVSFLRLSEFSNDYEAYDPNHFNRRVYHAAFEKIITLVAQTEDRSEMKAVGEIENGVMFGSNGYLFLAGGAHRVLDIVSGAAEISAESFKIFGKNIAARAAWAEQNGVQFAHLVMPDKQSIIPEEWPLSPPLKIGAAYIERNWDVQSRIIYPVPVLAENKARALSHVDTHLTDYGSILVTKLLVESLSGEPHTPFANELIRHVTKNVKLSGDLGSKLTPEVFDSEQKFDQPQPGFCFHNDFSGGNNGAVDLRFNPHALYQKRIAFFGDSFGRDIVRFLQFWYREVFFFRTGYFHEEIASLCKPDIVITENVERYLDLCRPDEERPHFLLYPHLQSKEYEPSAEFAAAFSAVLSVPRKPYLDFAEKLGMRECTTPVTPDQRQPSQIKEFDAVSLADYPPSAGLLSLLEEPKIVQQRPPAFVGNLSGREFPAWFNAQQDIHGSYLVRRENVLLFGPNHLVSGHGLWSCESRSFKRQFIDMLDFPSYNVIFPGPKPVIEFKEEKFVVSTSNLSPELIERIDEPIFLATPLEPDNWGRWIATVAPKAMQHAVHGAGRRFFCRLVKPWQRAFLNTFGISDEMILDHDPGRTYICSDVMTVEYSVTNMTISAQEREGFLKIAAKYKKPEGRYSKIFVSRLSHSKMHPGYRVLQNEPDLIAELAKLGFQSVEPELLPLEDQIGIFASAHSVVCLGGAALYNAVFCPPGTKLVTIEASDAFISPHTQLLSSLDLNYAIVFGQEDPTDPSPGHKRWTVDIEKAVPIIADFMSD